MNLFSRIKAGWSRIGKSYSERGGSGPYGALISYMGGNDPSLNPALLAESENAATLARAVWCVASDIAQVPLLVEKKVGKGKWERLDEDSSEFGGVAQVFQRVNDFEGRSAFWTKVYVSRATFGRAPILTDYVNGGRVSRGAPKELRYLRADWVTPAFGNGRGLPPTGYVYRPDGGEGQELRLDEVLYSLRPSIRNPWQGLSQIIPVRIFGMIENALGWYWHGYFRNGARAGVILETDEKLADKDVKRFRAEFNEQHSNANGRSFGTWLFHHGMKYKEPGAGRKDTDFADLARFTKEQIGMMIGVPPARLGDYSNAALANIEEQTPGYYEGTLIPEGAIMQEDLTEIVGPRFDPYGQIRFRYDWDSTPAMRRLALKRFTAYSVATGVPFMMPDEVRKLEGLEPLPNGLGEKYYLPFSVSPAGEAEPAPALPEPKAPPKGEPLKSVTLDKWIDTAERNSKRLRAGKSLDRFVPSAEREVRSLLRGQEERAIARAEKLAKALSGAITKKGSDDDGGIWDDEFEDDVTKSVLAKIYARVVSTRGPEAGKEVDSGFSMDHEDVVRYLDEHAYEMGKLINGTSRDLLRQAISSSTAESLTIQDLTSLIKDVFDTRRSHALTIARTEVSRSYNFATKTAWEQSGVVESQEWLTAHDDAVRDSHREMDKEQAALGEPFSNGCEYPGDPAGEPEETINCRCTTLPVLKTSEQRAYRFSRDLKSLFEKSA